KDAQDLAILCRRYESAGNQDRLYGAEIKLLQAVDYDLVLAGARLLGRDARAIANESTVARARTLLSDGNLVDRLLAHMAIELKAAEDGVNEAAKLLQQLKTGLLA